LFFSELPPLESWPDLLLSGWSTWAIAWCWLTVLGASVVRGYTGFGFSALVVSTHSLVLPPQEVIPATFLMEIVASVHLIPLVWKEVHWKRVLELGSGAALAMPIGLLALGHLPEATIRGMVYGVILLCTGLLLRNLRLEHEGGRWLTIGTGAASGLANGLAAVGGLPVVLMFLATSIGAATSRAPLVAYLFAGEIYAVSWLGGQDLISFTVVLRTLLFLPALVLGVSLGNRRFVRTPPESFRRFALWLLAIVCLLGLGRTFWGWM